MASLFTAKWFVCCSLVALISCSHKGQDDRSAALPPFPNIMEAAWAGIRADIDKLEVGHARLDEWKKSTPEFNAISSLPALKENTQNLGISDDEQRELHDAFAKSSSVFHFGYECNYHALVFFDAAKRAWKVIKW
jgi:hypothetical protein